MSAVSQHAISPHSGLPVKSSGQALAFVLITIFIDTVGIAIIIPVR